MKSFAATFGIYILFLTILPTFVNLIVSDKIEHCRKTCCPYAKSYENKSEKKDNGCNKEQCTPFFGCTKMQVIIPFSASLPCKPVISKTHFILFVESCFSTALTSVWHPRKLFNYFYF